MMNGDNLTLMLAFVGGVMSFLSPCVLPLIPGYISFVTGLSTAELEQGGGTAWRAALLPSILFVLGFSAVFVALGASVSAIGKWLLDNQPLLTRAGGILVILLGFFVIGWLHLAPLYRERRFHLNRMPLGVWGAPLAGAAFAFGWTPCVGPILSAILLKAGTVETAGQGMLMLAAYSLGLGIPFVASALLFSVFMGFSGWIKKRYALVTYISGSLLILMGLLMLADKMTRFSGFIQGLWG
ncbi:MAG: cytochrome c biogenesis protein CcdA [bacterium]|jgi:cytochrome c-type biogenesis protein|nr:cytochrome c biogenesis protein CcdA [bacterium]MDD3805016.1 cytochrome c biogenesis protein CcdA [bacterium]MDD4152388.1 cytochrome c biogenesis protein CcdA [bacterium]MDD4558433.1 cytochrome c biogenesis protein CcdA [bacterium]